MPLPARTYTGLQVAKAGTVLALEAPVPGSGVTGTTVHRYDLRQRRGDVLVSGVRFFEVSANGEKILTAQGDRWTIQNVRPLPPASGGPRRDSARVWRPGVFHAAHRRHRAPIGSDPRVEADVSRRVEDPARVLLRSESPRPGSPGRDQALRAVPGLGPVTPRPELRLCRHDGRNYRRPSQRRRWRRARRANHPHWTAGRRLQDRERALPVRPRLRRRELESRPARAADAAGRQRSGGRLPAVGQRP